MYIICIVRLALGQQLHINLPPSTWQGRLFGDGEELRKEFPAMPCLL